MEEKSELILNLNSKLVERFKQTAKMKNDDINDIIEDLISGYIININGKVKEWIFSKRKGGGFSSLKW